MERPFSGQEALNAFCHISTVMIFLGRIEFAVAV
jgi:hypothetical protein